MFKYLIGVLTRVRRAETGNDQVSIIMNIFKSRKSRKSRKLRKYRKLRKSRKLRKPRKLRKSRK